ncbi:MAG: tRNA preQ1(34) S-adenosylmethionine ribosyltransferase-isomerase QueA [Thermoleophilia bacterium]|nr:tRNA preQ1(34) S-adenosylmethionine ribosyltransferase-isomerase QueA [Thermoleophilia bacterium]
MLASELHYELPEQLIAQRPAATRGASLLMCVHAGALEVSTVASFDETLLDQLRPTDLVVANDSRVLHARLRGARATGGAAELLLLEPLEERRRDSSPPETSIWRAMGKPAKRLRDGDVITLSSGAVVEMCGRDEHDQLLVELPVPAHDADSWLAQHGELPLPPYITAADNDPARYQTVHARHAGSVAAPTAGLHFDDDMWKRVGEHCEIARVTLHVGAGTFKPVDADADLADHVMHTERYSVSSATDVQIRAAMADGRRIVSVGTTTVRVLESVYGARRARLTGTTDIFITPGYEFGCVGALLTNFHLPHSTLLALVMAFGGSEPARAWYREAVARELRFFSFGDAMFIHGA